MNLACSCSLSLNNPRSGALSGIKLKDVQIQSGHTWNLHGDPKTKQCSLPLYLLVGELRRKCFLLTIKNSVLSSQMCRTGGSRLKQLLLDCPRQSNETRNSKFSIHIEEAQGWLQWSSAWGKDVSTWNKQTNKQANTNTDTVGTKSTSWVCNRLVDTWHSRHQKSLKMSQSLLWVFCKQLQVLGLECLLLTQILLTALKILITYTMLFQDVRQDFPPHSWQLAASGRS